MLPTLISLGPLVISSFGFFLGLAFLFATFLAWRLSRAWDLSEEKVLDLCLLTFFGSLIGARVNFVLANFPIFLSDPIKIFLLTKYPGLIFWGGLLGGGLTLLIFSKRVRRISFWQMADLAGIGLLGAMIFGQIGCLLGGCNVGIHLGFGVNLVGFVGKRFPIQALEALLFTIALYRIWPVATHFHFSGKIACISLITLGAVEFVLSFLKEESWAFILPLLVFGFGLVSFYRLSKRNFKMDLGNLLLITKGLLTDRKIRAMIVKRLYKSWYSQKVAVRWSFYKMKKKLNTIRRRARVKPTPEF